MRALSVKEKLKLHVGKAVIYGTLGPELFSELFRTVDGNRAIQLLSLQIFAAEAPDLAGQVMAGIFSGLDYASHLVRLNPTSDAMDIMELNRIDYSSYEQGSTSAEEMPRTDLNEGGDELIEKIQLNRPSSCFQASVIISKIFAGILTEDIIINNSLMNAIAVYHIALYFYLKGQITQDAANLMIYILGGANVALDITCNNFLSLKDGIHSVDLWVDFKNSAFYDVFKHNKKAGIMAASKVFVNHSFNGAVHYLITKQFFWGVLPFASVWEVSDSTSEYIAYASAITAFIAFTLLKTNNVFENFRRPFLISLDYKPEYRYDYERILDEDRQNIWKNLKRSEKIKMMLHPATLGLIRGSTIGYITYTLFHYFIAGSFPGVLPEITSSLVALIPSITLLAHAIITEKEHALNVKSLENAESGGQDKFGLRTQLTTLLLNVGSQTIRGLIGMLAIHQMLGSTIGDRLATVLGLGFATEVALGGGLFFQKKILPQVDSKIEDTKVVLTKLGGLVCTRRKPGYAKIHDEAVNEDLFEEKGCCRKGCGF